jgi:Putative heavy-metal-binding
MLPPVEADKGNDMILSTMNDLPGYEVTEVIGEVFGITVRSDLRLRHRGQDPPRRLGECRPHDRGSKRA